MPPPADAGSPPGEPPAVASPPEPVPSPPGIVGPPTAGTPATVRVAAGVGVGFGVGLVAAGVGVGFGVGLVAAGVGVGFGVGLVGVGVGVGVGFGVGVGAGVGVGELIVTVPPESEPSNLPRPLELKTTSCAPVWRVLVYAYSTPFFAVPLVGAMSNATPSIETWTQSAPEPSWFR